MIEKGTYVRIRQTVLQPNERAANIPEETKKVPFKIWVKGYLQEESDLFDIVTIKTIYGREVKGRLKEARPPYRHGYGDFVDELLVLQERIKNDFNGGVDHE